MASAYSGRSAATASVTERIGVFWLVLASDFTLRSAARATPARATSSASAPAAASRRPSDCGQAAQCTEPVRYQLHTSSVAKGRKGASRRTKVSTAIASVARAERTVAAS